MALSPKSPRAAVVAALLSSASALGAQSASSRPDSARPAPAAGRAQTPAAPTPWYARLSLRGYAQIRYNRLLESNRNLTCAQCDRSIGNNGGIFLRRGRLVISGDVSSRVSVYVQPDFGSDAAGTLHYLQLRDAYFDLFLDRDKEHRLRFGQSKVPFGWANLQSSSNRVPLDRDDALNSAIPNERDMGVVYAWSPALAKRRFRILTDSGLKGTGDYGVFSFAVTNGQTANRAEANNTQHLTARLAYPFRLPNGQFIELGVQGYRGQFVLPARTATVSAVPQYDDERAALSAVWYAQPFGLSGEWTWGRGPEYDPVARRVDTRRLRGGYLQAQVRARRNGQVATPFARLQYYSGGKKVETDARQHDVREFELGVEWLPISAFELTAQLTHSNRLAIDGASTSATRQKGRFLRLQAQFNY
jgi:hypothetical protein